MILVDSLETILEFSLVGIYLIFTYLIYKRHKEDMKIGTKLIIAIIISYITSHLFTGIAHLLYDTPSLDNVTAALYQYIAVPAVIIITAFSIAFITLIFKPKHVKMGLYIGIAIAAFLVVLVYISPNVTITREGGDVELSLGSAKSATLIWLILMLGSGVTFLGSAIKLKGFERKKVLFWGGGMLITTVFKFLDAILTTLALEVKILAAVGTILFAYGGLIKEKA